VYLILKYVTAKLTAPMERMNATAVSVGFLIVINVRAMIDLGPFFAYVWPRAGSGVVRIDPLRFLVGCRTRQLNQA